MLKQKDPEYQRLLSLWNKAETPEIKAKYHKQVDDYWKAKTAKENSTKAE